MLNVSINSVLTIPLTYFTYFTPTNIHFFILT